MGAFILINMCRFTRESEEDLFTRESEDNWFEVTPFLPRGEGEDFDVDKYLPQEIHDDRDDWFEVRMEPISINEIMENLSRLLDDNMTDRYYFNKYEIKWDLTTFHIIYKTKPKLNKKYIYNYNGEQKDNMRHGRGICKSSYGEVYDGEWKNNKMHGKGKLTWYSYQKQKYNLEKFKRQNSYDGRWYNNNPQGEGTFTDGYGNIYEGKWHDGKKYGYGIWTTINGDKYKEQWDQKINKRIRSLILPNSLLRYNDDDNNNDDNDDNDEFSKIILQQYENTIPVCDDKKDSNEDDMETNDEGTDDTNDNDSENDYETMEDIMEDRLELMELLHIM